MRLTKSTSHAIRILIDCARAGDDLIKVASLSKRLDITPQNVFKIVNLLTKAGLIVAVRGRNGGVRLGKPATTIRIGDVVRATEVTHVEIEEGGAPATARSGQDVNRILDNALDAFIEVLDQHTIADMARAHSGSPSKRKVKKRSRAAHFPAARARRGVAGTS